MAPDIGNHDGQSSPSGDVRTARPLFVLEQSAVVELVETFRGQVFGLCYRMLRHRQDAEDVAQESFVRALRSLKSWDQKREFLPWLLAIAANRCRTAAGDADAATDDDFVN